MPTLAKEAEEKAEVVQTQPLIAEEEVQDLSHIDVSNRAYCHIKRLLDIILSAFGLTVLLIPLAIIALVVYIDDPGPVIFSQKRVGLNGKVFRLYKFRTMKKDTPKYMATIDVEDPDKYITRVGHVLRKLSLDELPQFFNVLKGNMSLVGPRPLIPNENEIHEMRSRFGVYTTRPGVTGYAQINGRDLVAPADKVRWDVKYLERFGVLTDLKILLLTVPKAFGGCEVVEGFDSRKQDESECKK